MENAENQKFHCKNVIKTAAKKNAMIIKNNGLSRTPKCMFTPQSVINNTKNGFSLVMLHIYAQ